MLCPPHWDSVSQAPPFYPLGEADTTQNQNFAKKHS
jgi:hypothetical protein